MFSLATNHLPFLGFCCFLISFETTCRDSSFSLSTIECSPYGNNSSIACLKNYSLLTFEQKIVFEYLATYKIGQDFFQMAHIIIFSSITVVVYLLGWV